MIAYILNSQLRKDKPQRQASYIGLLFPEYKYYHYQLQFCNGMFEFLTFELNKYALKSAYPKNWTVNLIKINLTNGIIVL